MTALSLTPVNPDAYSVHLSNGAHVGNLKRIGAVWKFKAIGYDAAGKVIPGGGPLTERHNTAFAAPDAQEVSARLARAQPRGGRQWREDGVSCPRH